MTDKYFNYVLTGYGDANDQQDPTTMNESLVIPDETMFKILENKEEFMTIDETSQTGNPNACVVYGRLEDENGNTVDWSNVCTKDNSMEINETSILDSKEEDDKCSFWFHPSVCRTKALTTVETIPDTSNCVSVYIILNFLDRCL